MSYAKMGCLLNNLIRHDKQTHKVGCLCVWTVLQMYYKDAFLHLSGKKPPTIINHFWSLNLNLI